MQNHLKGNFQDFVSCISIPDWKKLISFSLHCTSAAIIIGWKRLNLQ